MQQRDIFQLIHLIQLAGTDEQIDQSKGASQLSAGQIRARVNALGSPSASAARSARTQQHLQADDTDFPDVAPSFSLATSRVPAWQREKHLDHPTPDNGTDSFRDALFSNTNPPRRNIAAFENEDPEADENYGKAREFRDWIDAL